MSNEEFYTASQAQRVLGLDKFTFHRRVNEGSIPSFTPPGKKQHIYPKRDIDALALSMRAAFGYRERIYFSRSTPGDQVEELRIGVACFGEEFITPLPERIAFQQKAEFSFWSLKVDGRVVGYLSTFRLPDELLNALLAGLRIEREIRLEDILPFRRLEPFDIYVDVMAVDPALPLHERRLYAGLIVQRFANKVLDLRANNYQIRHIYTVTATKEGDNLVRAVGFRLMEDVSLAPGRVAYEFPIDDKGIERLIELSGRGLPYER